MGRKRAASDPAYVGRRVCIDAAADALNRCRDLNPMQKGAFRAVLLGGVLTRSRAVSLGYDVDDVCELCGEAGDCVFHRTYQCRATEHLVKNAVPKWFWDEAQKADQNDQFWTTATVPHPADFVPLPRSDYQSWAFDADGNRCDDPNMHGHVFIDGSCSQSVFRGLQRAALALVQLSEDAHVERIVSVPIWNTLPQTSQSAEFAAFAGLSHVLDAEAVAYGDCKGVLDQPPRRQRSGTTAARDILVYCARC